MDFLLRNARIPRGEKTVLVDVLVEEGQIAGIVKPGLVASPSRVFDAQGRLVVPGCIDPHVHLNDPGFTHRETFETGTAAAARGGITTVIDMPCSTNPPVRCADDLRWKHDAVAAKACVDFAFWGGITGEDVRNGNLHRMREQAEAGAVGFKVYMTASAPTYPGVTHGEMLEVLRMGATVGRPVGVHAEDLSLSEFYVNKFRAEGRTDPAAWSEARLVLAERVAVETAALMAEEAGCRLHIVHLSSGAGVEIVARARARGVSLTAETCPQYLALNAAEHMTRHGALAKIAPPLRSARDNDQLWKALRDGQLDFVGTDHAPLKIPEEKFGSGMDIWTAYPGFPGLETLLPVMVSEGLNKGRLSLSRFVEVTSAAAARLYGLYPRKGCLAVGADADFTIIDLQRDWVFDAANTATMGKYSPFHGMAFKGKPMTTILRGVVVYDEETRVMPQAGTGRLVRHEGGVR